VEREKSTALLGWKIESPSPRAERPLGERQEGRTGQHPDASCNLQPLTTNPAIGRAAAGRLTNVTLRIPLHA